MWLCFETCICCSRTMANSDRTIIFHLPSNSMVRGTFQSLFHLVSRFSCLGEYRVFHGIYGARAVPATLIRLKTSSWLSVMSSRSHSCNQHCIPTFLFYSILILSIIYSKYHVLLFVYRQFLYCFPTTKLQPLFNQPR